MARLQRLDQDGKATFRALRRAQTATRWALPPEATKVVIAEVVRPVTGDPPGWAERVNRSREGC